MSSRLERLRGRPVVYRLYHDKQLIYVGETLDVSRRFIEHAIDKPWWYLVTDYKLFIATSKTDALHIERMAIINESPIFNIAHATAGSDLRREEFVRSHPITIGSPGFVPAYSTVVSVFYNRYGTCLPLSMTLPAFINALKKGAPA